MYKNINLLSYKDFDIVAIVQYLESIFHSSKGLSVEERKKIESFLIFVIILLSILFNYLLINKNKL